VLGEEVGGDENRAALEAVAELFQRSCDRLFLGLLLPDEHVLAAGLPAVDSASLRAVDAPLATAAPRALSPTSSI
jgi:hypothetical protein